MLKKVFHEEHEDGTKFYILYSTLNNCVLQEETDTLYDEVCITDDDTYTYIETDIPIEEDERTDISIEEDERTEIELKAEAYDIIIGEKEYE